MNSFTIATVEQARIDCWAGQPAPLITCESRATAGVLSRIARQYQCPITGTGGQAGGFLVNDVAPLLIGNARPVLYIGDLEVGGPGEQIEANTRRYLEEHADRDFTAVTWIRVALTQAQVDRSRGLRDLVLIKYDKRYDPPRPYQAWECEAVGQAALETILRRQLNHMLPEPLAVLARLEQRQRAQVRRLLAKLGKPQRPRRARSGA
jgi:hypothetical protein